jgi:membrane fusion protein, multidrug efflux system
MMKNIIIKFYLTPLLLLGACSAGGNKEAAVQNKPETLQVKIITLQLAPVTTKLSLTGEIISLDRADIFARTKGYVKEVKVDIGSRVKKGQELCLLEAPELNASKAQSQSNSMAALSKFQSSKNIYLRLLRASRMPGAIAVNELETAADQMKADSAAYQASRSAAEVTKVTEEYLVIRAPFNGVVTARNIFKGDFVDDSGKSMLFSVEDNSKLRIDVPVPEAFNATILKDNEGTFTVSANPGQIFKAKLARKSDAIESQTRSETWELMFDNSKGILKPGMFAQVNLPVSRMQEGFLVPYKAVVTTQERKFVIRVVSGKAHWVDVKTGFTNIDKTEVSGDLKPGDQIIDLANEEIKDGNRVKVKD